MRTAFIEQLTRLAANNKNIMLLTGDLGFTVFEEFRQKCPEQFINVGVAEQNLIGLAAGLALSGKSVVAYSIATFITMRAFEQIRDDIAVHNLPVVVIGSGAGLSYGVDSVTHHATEDISLMRSIPHMRVLCPADPFETSWALERALDLHAPVYLRLGKKGEPKLYNSPPKLKLGKGSILQRGRRVAILATGTITYNALTAAQELKKSGLSVTCVSMHTIKPLDKELIYELVKTHPFIFTIEEHSIIGGLGSAVAEVLSPVNRKYRHISLGIPDTFLYTIGSQQFHREQLGLSAAKIVERIKQELTL